LIPKGPLAKRPLRLRPDSVTQFDLDPDEYMAEIRAELPRYDDLEDAVARATQGVNAARILELGVGVGETAERVLRAQPVTCSSRSGPKML